MTSNNGDDYIGTESCIDLQNDVVVDYSESQISKTNRHEVKSSSKKKEKKKELPPPIPHISRVLRRYCSNDGRLILKEEKVKHQQQFFQAHRANGRLTLHLVPLNHQATEVEAPQHQQQNSVTLTDVQDNTSIVTDELPMESSKCLNCNRVRSPSCGVPVHPVRTVQG